MEVCYSTTYRALRLHNLPHSPKAVTPSETKSKSGSPPSETAGSKKFSTTYQKTTEVGKVDFDLAPQNATSFGNCDDL